jgi:hypothetical protein
VRGGAVAQHLGDEGAAELAELGGGVELQLAGGPRVAQAADLGVGQEVEALPGELEAAGDLELEGALAVAHGDLVAVRGRDRDARAGLAELLGEQDVVAAQGGEAAQHGGRELAGDEVAGDPLDRGGGEAAEGGGGDELERERAEAGGEAAQLQALEAGGLLGADEQAAGGLEGELGAAALEGEVGGLAGAQGEAAVGAERDDDEQAGARREGAGAEAEVLEVAQAGEQAVGARGRGVRRDRLAVRRGRCGGAV